jgi:hypothetical protein
MSISAGAVLGILSLIASLTGGGISAAQNDASETENRRQRKWQRRVKATEQKQVEEADRERRKQALARAIGSDVEFAPQEALKMPEQPEPADMSGYNIAKGISNVVAQGAAGASGMLGDGQTSGDTAMGDLAPGTTAAGASTYTPTAKPIGDYNVPQGDPLASNKYQRYSRNTYRYS